jgi:integrase
MQSRTVCSITASSVVVGTGCAVGAGVFSIQAAMGHAQIVTSQRYVHWSRGVEDSAAFRLPLRIARR